VRAPASRLDGGQAIREAMKATGHNRLSLAARTKEVDEDGHGVSQQLIAFLSTDKPWGRNTTTARSATLIARGLGKPAGELFTMPESFMTNISTQN
jgi:hypothetical protein